MMRSDWLAPSEMLAVFTVETQAAGGRVFDPFQDKQRLFVRSILPSTREVGPGDKIQGGVALKGDELGISVHPYTFRQVCTNGAIIAQAVQSVRIDREEVEFADPAEAVREAVQACCARGFRNCRERHAHRA